MEHTIKIDVRKTVSENADAYYSDAKKARVKLEGARKALESTREKIRELEEKQEVLVEARPVIEKKKKTKWYEKFHHFVSSDGFLIVCGKDASTNEILIKKYTEKDDLVFHADLQGAPFCVIKNPEKIEIPENTLSETASAAASYSKAWKQNLGSCDVYYITPEQVSKSAPSGEYLGKGAFMIYGKKEWFRGVRLVIAVGFRMGEEIEVLAGPIPAVDAGSDYHVSIIPGEKKSGDLAKNIKAAILRRTGKEDGQRIKKLNLDLIQRVIPGGRGRMAE